MWKAIETSTGKVRMGKAKERRSKGGSGEEEKEKEKEKEKETKKEKDSGSKEGSKRVGNMRRGGGSSKVRSRSKEVSAGEVS